MEWTDIGIVLGTRRHGEANAILELMTPAHGRHLGLGEKPLGADKIGDLAGLGLGRTAPQALDGP